MDVFIYIAPLLVSFTLLCCCRALERDATRIHKGFALLFLLMWILMGVAMTMDRPTPPPPTPVRPTDLRAISFPPSRAFFANGTGIPAHWHVICAWPSPWRSCAHADVDDYARVHTMPCHLRAKRVNGTRDTFDISSATIACETQLRDHNHERHIVPYVVQNSCNVTIEQWHRPWVARDSMADALLAEHEAALGVAQIVGGRPVLPVVYCDIATGAALRHVKQAVQHAVEPIAEIVKFIKAQFNAIRELALFIVEELICVEQLLHRISDKLGVHLRMRTHRRLCEILGDGVSETPYFKMSFPLDDVNCTAGYPTHFGSYRNSTAFATHGMSLHFLLNSMNLRTHGPHIFGLALFVGIAVSFCFVAPSVADIVLHVIAFGLIWLVRCTTLPQVAPLLHEAADTLERIILPWTLLSRIRAIAYK